MDTLEVLVSAALILLLLVHAMPGPRGLRPQDIEGYM